MKRGPLAMLLAILLPVPAAAQDTAALIDHYRYAPRAPGTYRALAGLGDPDRGRLEEGYEPIPESQRDLLARMLPGQDSMASAYWYPQSGACRTDYALSVAEARVAQLGADHPYVEQWMRVQRAVFSACRNVRPWEPPRRGISPPVALPPPMRTEDSGIAALQRDDRAYQSAALLFYRDDPAAARAFRAIAGSSSPHAPIARYMLAALPAREVDRYAWPADDAQAARRDRSARAALAEARAILADPRLTQVHPLAQGLIGFLGYHTGDARIRAAQVRTTLDALEAPIARIERDEVAADRYGRAVADIDWLHGDFPDPAWWLNDTAPAEMTASRAMAEAARTRPIAAWLLFPQSPFELGSWATAEVLDRDGRLDAFASAQAERESGIAWAVLRASTAFGYEPEGWAQIDALRDATLAAPTEPGVASIATLFYHQVRTALMYPLYGEAYRNPDRASGFAAAMARVESWPWKDSRHYRELVSDMLQYLIAEGRLAEARRVRDRLDPRGEGYETAIALLLLAEDEEALVREIAAAPERGRYLLNQLSIAALARLAAREALPHEVRARFARVAWARLYALERPIPRALDLLMRRLNPEIAAGWSSRTGARPDDRRLLLDVLRSPGLNILIVPHQRTPDAGGGMGYADWPGLAAIDTFEHSDNNWWCAWQPDRHRLRAAAVMFDAFFADDTRWSRDPLTVAGAPAALGPLLRASWLWQARDEAEQAALAAIRSAPQLLAERALAWRSGGLFRRSLPGQDEALALAVRSTRYGCQRQGGHGSWSRAAHALLHRRFAGSAAAARTRWWFDCSHFTGGCERRREEEETDWRRWTDSPYD